MFSFQWHITDRCSNRCKHCYQDFFDDGVMGELSVEVLIKFVDVIISGVDESLAIDVTGGEPLLYGCGDDCRDDNNEYRVFKLLKYLSSQEKIKSVGLITNGTIVNQEIINELLSIKKLKHVKVSLESYDRKVNDEVRGAGNFDVVTRNIKKLTNESLPVIIMVTLGNHNYNDIEKICELAISLGARGVMFERYVPIGYNDSFKHNVISAENWENVLRTIAIITNMDDGDQISRDESLKLLDNYKAFIINMPHGKLGDDCELQGATCCIGKSSMALMPDGTVYPCRRVPVAVGKLVDESHENLMDNFKSIMKKLKKFASDEELCMSQKNISAEFLQ